LQPIRKKELIKLKKWKYY